ncbi:MAG: IS3 family transposase [Clostridiales bacterium]|nr:IS3 family transposase [Clostridiales bacterium]MBS5877208.1 IS3 family transposase [Clostridiales bacterium]
MLKKEMYYGKRFTNLETLANSIGEYIHYYNTERIQRKLKRMSPLEYHEYLKEVS